MLHVIILPPLYFQWLYILSALNCLQLQVHNSEPNTSTKFRTAIGVENSDHWKANDKTGIIPKP